MKLNKFFIVLILILVSNVLFAAGNGKVGLIIKPPKSEGGGVLMTYLIEYKKIDEKNWKQEARLVMKIENVYPKQEEYIQDLETGEEYIFRVRVENIIGEGEAGPQKKIKVTENGPIGVEIECGKALEGKSTSFSNLSSITTFVNQTQDTKLTCRKEEYWIYIM